MSSHFSLPSKFIKDTGTRDNLLAIERAMNQPNRSVQLSAGGTRMNLTFDGSQLIAEVGGVSKVVADWSA